MFLRNFAEEKNVYSSNKTYQSKALNYFHLFLAILTAIYIGISLLALPQASTTEAQQTQLFTKYFLLIALCIDLLLGVYVTVSNVKPILFFQALSAMLLLAAHFFFIYAYFAFENGFITPQSSLETGVIILLFSCFLHLFNFWKFSSKPNTVKSIDIDDDFFMFEE